MVIGGDGSLRGAAKLFEEQGVAVIGIPGTIDNDIFGTDVSVGFNTAINIALDAIDRLRDTAASHNRLFLVEVMGSRSGNIGLYVGVAGGAEAILLPEIDVDPDTVADTLIAAQERGKASSVVVVAEGASRAEPWPFRSASKTSVSTRSAPPFSAIPNVEAAPAPATACSPRASDTWPYRSPRRTRRAHGRRGPAGHGVPTAQRGA